MDARAYPRAVHRPRDLYPHPARHLRLRRRRGRPRIRDRVRSGVAHRAHRSSRSRNLVLAHPLSPAGADAGSRHRLDIPDGAQCRMAQSGDPRSARPRGTGTDRHFQHGWPDPVPGAGLDAVRLPAAHLDLARHGPGAGGSERRVRRVSAHDVPPGDAAGAAAGASRTLDPGYADHRRAVRTAAHHRPARENQRVQLSHLFRAQSALQPAQLRRRRGAVAALRRARRAAAARLQSPDQARGQLRHRHRERLPAATPAARRLANSRADPGEPLYRAGRDPSRRRAAVDEFFRLHAADLRDVPEISAWKPIGRCSPIGRSGWDCAIRFWSRSRPRWW